jgi:serine/threonine protein kinase
MVARVVGRYELVRELGRGGTATVYLARQTDLNRLVALKELTALPVSDPSTARRFIRESRLAGSLNHPNIVTVHDFFEDHGTPYIAMEYLERGSLRPLMHELAFAQVAKALEGLLAGLAFAHARGIVHRDLKPENLMVSGDDRLKIADFGIAKVTDEAHVTTALTIKGTTIGTPTYMAPEQAMGGDIGSWTDLYAVGVIAFELLAGRPPFDTSGAPMAILLRHVNEPPLELATCLL